MCPDEPLQREQDWHQDGKPDQNGAANSQELGEKVLISHICLAFILDHG
jgi:hypothetical protein